MYRARGTEEHAHRGGKAGGDGSRVLRLCPADQERTA